ncbi:hypothetical protein ElyMa_001282000 [Elysia marginata]|uniref:AGC-kinase C-terminal domain-containing protein n=1 Tax=Elysia marginata TaxID=1093978 RepID=A0AAV4IDY4_9GAST|nr:hypothetical protein ElyMa_001282000 [Elysia marginata]
MTTTPPTLFSIGRVYDTTAMTLGMKNKRREIIIRKKIFPFKLGNSPTLLVAYHHHLHYQRNINKQFGGHFSWNDMTEIDRYDLEFREVDDDDNGGCDDDGYDDDDDDDDDTSQQLRLRSTPPQTKTMKPILSPNQCPLPKFYHSA